MVSWPIQPYIIPNRILSSYDQSGFLDVSKVAILLSPLFHFRKPYPCWKTLECLGIPKCLNPLPNPYLKKKITRTFFFKGVAHEWVTQMLNDIIGWYCLDSTLLCKEISGKKSKPFIHLSFDKAVPFTLESNLIWIEILTYLRFLLG